MKSEWKRYALGDITELVIDYRGKTPKKLGGDWSDRGYRALSAKNIKTGHIVQPDTIRFVDEDMYRKWMKDEIRRGDILITSEAPFGQILFWDSDEKIVLSQRLFGVRIKKTFDPMFIYYYMTTSDFQGEMAGRATGTTVIGLRQPELMKCEVCCPDIERQKRIASILSSIDEKIELNNKINENLERQVAEIYKSWYQDFSKAANLPLVETEFGLIPQGWRYVFLGDICKSISVTHKFDKDKLVFLNTGDIEDGRFLHSNYMAVKDMPGQAKKTIAPGDILHSEIRPINRHFAYVNFPSEDYVVSTKLMVIRARGFDTRRLYHFLTSKDILSELQMQAESRSGTFPQIRFDNVSKLPILIADRETETAFIDLLHTVYDQIEYHNLENEKLATLRDTLLPKLMSGEIDVSDIQL